MSKKFKPSKYQAAIHEEVKSGKSHISVNAVAGSGKTTTIEESLAFIKSFYDVAFCAFNNEIVDELGRRIKRRNTKVSTIHSIGWSAIKNYFGRDNCHLDEYKAQNLAFKMFSGKGYKSNWGYIQNLVKLVDLLRCDLSFSEMDVENLAYKHDINLIGEEVKDSLELFGAMLDDTTTFDFTDMVFMPTVVPDMELPKFDFVFTDEAQDLNKPQQFIVTNMLGNDKSRLISVGDRHQAIYGFAAADTESFDNLANRPNTKKLPLSICYRCSKAVVREAQKIVPHIEPFDLSPEGSVIEDGNIDDIRSGDWVICRNTKPLIVLCLELIKQHKKAQVVGKDIGKGLTALIKNIKVNNKILSLKLMERKLDKLHDELKEKGISKPKLHHKYISLREKIEIIEYISLKMPDMASTIKLLDSIFTDDVADIMLMTIHRSKGRENERVFFLLPQLIPSKYAKQYWQLEQETNLKYVGITRAKLDLIYVPNFDYK